MKALVLADLHFLPHNLERGNRFNELKRSIKLFLEKQLNEVDIVLIAGDVIESSVMKYGYNPLDNLYDLFEKPIIFCLGNHEFAYKKHSDVIKYWSNFKHEYVHCLDIEGHVQINDCNFIGNVLWYDFTLGKSPSLMIGEIVDNWLDSTIEDFDPIKECQKCKEQIYKNISYDKNIKNILITHTVPLIDLNTFSKEQPFGLYNAYSGSEKFLLEVQDTGAIITYAICGHTHRREIMEVDGTYCINIGNDYFSRSNKIENLIIEI